MGLMEKLLAGALAAFLLLALGRVFRAPLRLALGLMGNALMGFAALWAVNATAFVTGVSLGINPLNALLIAILGLPGLVLLVLAQWVV